MPEEHDNHNRGTLWDTGKSGWSGKIDVEDVEYYGSLVATGAPVGSAPTHKLFIESKEQGNVLAEVVALFKPKKEKKDLIANGSTSTHWVDIYSGKTSSGWVLRVACRVKEEVQPSPAPPAPDAPEDDQALPF